MEFIDEDAKPRFLFQSRPSSSPPETLKISKLHLSTCLSASAIISITAFLLPNNSILFSLLIWISLSLLIAPFAPNHATGKNPNVGLGDPLPPPPPIPSISEEPRRRPTPRWNPNPNPNPNPSSLPSVSPISKPDEKIGVNSIESEWTADDFEILKRQILKHPVGAPGRWERVSEAFKGRHGVDSVIHAAKSLAERRSSGDDSFALFLKRRKPLEKQGGDVDADCFVSGNVGWSSAEDIVLLNALKAFPKETAMRWEKVAAAMPGKSKAECVKRVGELKRDFRSSKMS